MRKRNDWWWFNYLFIVMFIIAIALGVGGFFIVVHFVQKCW